jgi:hypothetical protein
MMRLCPKCGDYYADASLAFCLTDGTPLVNVAPNSDSWREGARVIEGKENALMKQKRKLKWRRVFVSSMTMLITTLVVCVVALNAFIYLKPKQEEVALDQPLTPETGELSDSDTPGTPDEPVSTPQPTVTPGPAASPIVTIKTTPTPTPTPTPVYKISGRVTNGSQALGGINITLGGAKTTMTTTDANGNYTFTNLPSGGNYTITPARAKIDFTPSSRSINNLAQDKSADFVGTVQPECSVADNDSESATILKTYKGRFSSVISGDPPKITAESLPIRIPNANVLGALANIRPTLVGTIEYEVKFPKACRASVTASFVWQVKTKGTPIGPEKTVNIQKEKRFACVKTGETWHCP